MPTVFELGWGESRPARNAKMPPPSPRNFNSDATQLRPRRMDLSPVPQPVLLNSLSSSFDQDDLFAVPDFVRVSQTPPGPSTSRLIRPAPAARNLSATRNLSASPARSRQQQLGGTISKLDQIPTEPEPNPFAEQKVCALSPSSTVPLPVGAHRLRERFEHFQELYMSSSSRMFRCRRRVDRWTYAVKRVKSTNPPDLHTLNEVQRHPQSSHGS